MTEVLGGTSWHPSSVSRLTWSLIGLIAAVTAASYVVAWRVIPTTGAACLEWKRAAAGKDLGLAACVLGFLGPRDRSAA